MTDIVERRWFAYSKRNPLFEILGYSKLGDDHSNDAVKAIETLSKYLKEPIPSDVELCMMPPEQLESEGYSG